SVASMPGLISGTAPYMSPEQARGRAVDKRTDIFAFGCVLYEMLSGKRAFDGEDVSEVLGTILKVDPDCSQLPARVPSNVRNLLKVCLEKNLKNRCSDATDVRLLLELALKEPLMPESGMVARTERRSRWGWIVAGIAAAFVFVLAFPAARYLLRPTAMQ